MHAILARTFGALAPSCYLRHFVFGLLVPALYIFVLSRPGSVHLGMAAMFTLNAFLYPYSRVLYEALMSFILGDHGYQASIFVLAIFKLFTMAACWIFGVFLAPVALVYLYFRTGPGEPAP
jgi:hypothetical protein